MFRHDLKVGESITIGDVKLTLQRKSGQLCSLLIDVPDGTPIETSRTRSKKAEEPQQETV